MFNSPMGCESPRNTRNLRGGYGVPLSDDEIQDLRRAQDANGEPRSNLRDVSKDDLGRKDLTGFCLGQYALGRKLGEGGMGAVFVARHLRLDKQFAVKFIGTDVAGIAEAHARFDQEIVALGKLRHPNIVDAVDAGTLNGVKYLVTELADGKDFECLVEQHGAIGVANACELIRQAALRLSHSHQCGLVHRDIKPSNLILDRTGVVKVLDFGLVRNASIEHRLTDDGRMLGTLDFMAPEQGHDARQVDARADVYSLGCTLLYLLSGEPPYSDIRYSSMAAKLKGHLFDRPEWLTQVPGNIPKKLIKLLERMIAKSPTDRIPRAKDVCAAIAPFASKSDLSILTGTDRSSLSTVPHVRTSPARPWFRFRLSRTWVLRSFCVAAVVACLGLCAFGIAGAVKSVGTPADPENQLPQIVSFEDGLPLTSRRFFRRQQPPTRIIIQDW